MAIKLVREFKQNQQLSITPQLKKSIDLLQLSRLEIISKINNEIEENPFLTKDYENQLSGAFDDMDLLDNLSSELTLQNHLKSQLDDLKLKISERKIALFIIQSLELYPLGKYFFARYLFAFLIIYSFLLLHSTES